MGIKYRSPGKWQVFANDGTPGAGYKLYTYVPGTTTNKDTYLDSAGASAQTNPVVFDARGEAVIFWNGEYDLKLTTDADVEIWTLSNFGAGEDSVNYGNYNLVNDGGFEDDSNGDGLPDQWTVTEYPNVSYGAGVAVLDSTTQIEGLYALKFTSVGDGGGYAESAYLNVREGAVLSLVWQMQSSIATVRNVVEVIWYTAAKTQISTSTIYDASSGNPTAWAEESGNATVPSTARFAKIRVTGCHSSVTVSGSTWFDDLYVTTDHTSGSAQVLANNVFLQGQETGGTARNLAGVNTSNQVELGNTNIAGLLKFANYLGLGPATDNFFNEISGTLYLSYGAYYNGTNWIATQTEASIFALASGGGNALYYDSGITVSNSFTPTKIYEIANTGRISTGKIAGKFVTDASGYPLISTTSLIVTFALAVNTWTSIGPTGSGASVIWTALDSVPTDADWIEVKVLASASDTTGAAALTVVAARKNGTAAVYGTSTAIAKSSITATGNTADVSDTITLAKIPLIAGAIFDLYWSSTGNSPSASMWVAGYGYNNA